MPFDEKDVLNLFHHAYSGKKSVHSFAGRIAFAEDPLMAC